MFFSGQATTVVHDEFASCEAAPEYWYIRAILDLAREGNWRALAIRDYREDYLKVAERARKSRFRTPFLDEIRDKALVLRLRS